ncbi:MAG: DNA adenine methylase [Verrucomicrobiota bacterium]
MAGAAAQPFLKWVGGKSQLLPQFDRFFPRQIDRYVEPFIGGGAVFFHLKARFPQIQASLRDDNAELINCYEMVRDDVKELMRRLDEHVLQFQTGREEYYYRVRSRHQLKDPLERAARMIFLNKTCFNGLWRVNARGEFNVPIGSYKKISLYDRKNILAVSRALQGVDLAIQDFRQTLEETRRDDFVYVDPPYHPVSRTANFTAYTKGDFGLDKQRDLATFFADAAGRGVRLMLSNSSSDVIGKLYRDFQIHYVQARRAINCQGDKRGAISEILVLSYEIAW